MKINFRLYLGAIALALSFNGICQSFPSVYTAALTDWQKVNLKGTPEVVDIISHKPLVKNDEIVAGEEESWVSYYYIKNGMLKKQENNDQEGNVIRKSVNFYDEKGRYIGFELYREGMFIVKMVHQLNDRGVQIAGHTLGTENEIGSRWVYALDDNGRPVERQQYTHKTGQPTFKCLYRYDSKGNVIEETNYGRDGLFSFREEFIYNSKGQLTGSRRYTKDGAPTKKVTYEYDKRGNEVEKNEHDLSAKTAYRMVYTYDEKNNMTNSRKYNQNGALEETRTCEYRYDAKGNWTRKIEYKDGKPLHVIIQNVLYY